MNVPDTPPFPRPRDWLLLAAGLVVLYVCWLGTRGLNEPDEGRYANIALAMAQPGGGGWWEPRLSGYGHYDKPPGIYWATALSLRVFGINEWAARLPSLAGALLALGGLGWAAYRLRGANVAWWAVLIGGTSVQFWTLGRILSPDMLLTGWCTLAIAAWAEGRHRGGTWGWWGVGLVCWTLAWWVKATAALVPLAGLAAGVWLTRDLVGRRALRPFLLLAAVVALGAPWYLSMLRLHPELRGFFFGRELAGRLAGRVDGRHGNVLYYLPICLVGWLPWWPLAVWRLWREHRERAAKTEEAGQATQGWSGQSQRVVLRPCRGSGEGTVSPGAHAPGSILTPLPGLGATALPGAESATLPGKGASLPGAESATLPGVESATLPGVESATLPGVESATLPGKGASLPGAERQSFPRTGSWLARPGVEGWIVLVGVAIFSCIGSKLPTYTLTLAPWAALWIARGIVGAGVPTAGERFPTARLLPAFGFAAVALVCVAVLPGRYESRLGVNSSLQDVYRLLRARGATRVDLDHYWPSAEFYLGPQTVHYLFNLDGPPPATVDAAKGEPAIERLHERATDPGVGPHRFVDSEVWPALPPDGVTADTNRPGGWWFVRFHVRPKPKFEALLANPEVARRPVKVARFGDFDVYHMAGPPKG